jgi:acetate kinase
MASPVILCLNSGSSSLKFALYRIGEAEELLLTQGAAELNDERVTRLWIHSPHKRVEKTGSEISAASTPLYALSLELKAVAASAS